MMVRGGVVGLGLACVVGCATSSGGGGGVDVSAFPSRAEVAALASRPAPALTVPAVRAVTSWTFVGPFDGQFNDVPVAAPTALETAVTGAQVSRVTMAGRCIAREMAHAIASTGEMPDGRFRDQVEGRCGSVGQSSNLMYWIQPVPAASTTKVEPARAEAAAAMAGMQGDLGVGFAHVGERAVTVLLSTRVDVRIAGGSRLATHGAVTISGALVDVADAESLWATVNQGDTGFASCERRGGVLPQFVISCPVLPGDEVAAFDIMVQRRGRLIGNGVATGLLGTAIPSTTWEATTYGANAPLASTPLDVAAALLERTNGIRAAAELSSLQPEPAQSATATALAPHLFSDDPSTVDRAGLAAMAGWDLTSRVRDGHLSGVHVYGGTLHELLGGLLDSPSARSALFAPDVRPAAFGVIRNGDLTSLLLTTWEPYVEVPAAQVQSTVFEALKAERLRRGFQGLGEVGMERAVQQASEQLQAGEDPSGVLRTLLRTTSKTMQRDFVGWTLLTTDPDHIAWPNELLTSRMTYVAVAAGTPAPKGTPWAVTAVLIVAFVEPGMVADAGSTVLPAR